MRRVHLISLMIITWALGLLSGYVICWYMLSPSLEAFESLSERLYKLREEYSALSERYRVLLAELENIKELLKIRAYALVDAEYYTSLLNYIERANRSIAVMMYMIKYDVDEPNDPVNTLIDALGRAVKRGVVVRVVIDDVTLDEFPQTIEFMKSHGILVRLDESSAIRTHVKLVIIDGYVVFIGSHNWTESGLMYNHEVTAVIISRSFATKLVQFFEDVWSKGRSI
ncbi:MAG: hypothetical protein DRN15_06775 [Thermoprotei archaeon]|nr:MAG: hypothetical protein DRN15_06775 [Thermoprotei archaeon]RLF25824.1 MAG: hypothetical protein DRM97_00455 [Thermoprotei archaeon]